MTGELVLLEVQPNGKTKQAFSDTLPLEITLSPIPLPPDPGEEGKVTLEGIDLDQNGVRDDIDRYIGFTYPNSAKVREALKQQARRLQVFLRDADDKAKSRENALADGSLDCLLYIYGGLNADLNTRDTTFNGVISQFLNTPERSLAYDKADSHLGGMIFERTRLDQLKTKCSFDPDSLPN